MKYYLDSCIVIYIIEKIADYRDLLIDLIPEEAELIVSDLTRMECRAKPMQSKNIQLLEEYDLFFNESTEVINLTTDAIDKATEVRAFYTFKTIVAADLGCGEDLLRKEIPDNQVLSFDHIAINNNVIASDISHLPLEDESVDIAVFSLSLMGTNYKEYLEEAFRILKAMGVLPGFRCDTFTPRCNVSCDSQ